jgi:hypothetical protein
LKLFIFKPKKINSMKALKLFILVSVFGFFTACGGAKTEETTTTDTTAVEAPAEAPATNDSTAAPATTDTTAAPAAQ